MGNKVIKRTLMKCCSTRDRRDSVAPPEIASFEDKTWLILSQCDHKVHSVSIESESASAFIE